MDENRKSTLIKDDETPKPSQKTTKEKEKKEVEYQSAARKEKRPTKTFKIPKIKWFTITLLFITFISIYLKTNVYLKIDKPFIIALTSISIMINIVIIGTILVTGIGQKVFKRFRNRLLFHTGRYVNVLYLNKNGLAKEMFKKVDPDTKTFNILNQKFIRNPRLLFSFEKIPTYLIREGNPDPLNIWDDKLASDFSNAELDLAMTSAQNFDLKQWINKHKMIIAIALLIIIGVSAASAFAGFMSFQMLRDGTYKAIECVTKATPIIPGV